MNSSFAAGVTSGKRMPLIPWAGISPIPGTPTWLSAVTVATEPMALDAIRVSVYSKDDATPLKSIHFRGEAGRSWVVARVAPDDVIVPAPFQARITPLTAPVTVGQPVAFDGSGSTSPINGVIELSSAAGDTVEALVRGDGAGWVCDGESCAWCWAWPD